MKQPVFAALTGNLPSLVGTILVTASALLIVVLALVSAAGLAAGWQLGIVAFVVLPGVFLLGWLLVAIGAWQRRRRARRAAARAGTAPPPLPRIDLNDPATRASLAGALLITVASLALLGAAGYGGVQALDSTQFCTQACHTVMQPEAVAHARSPHADVACVECHVGPGASWFVKAKINGLKEMAELALGSYPRPIPTPLHGLRPARVVCEQCHWPQKFEGDRLVIRTHYGDDERNSATKTVLMLHVGGQAGSSASGIHWHVGPGVAIRYLSDPSREHIFTVELRTPGGAVKTYLTGAVPPVDAQWRAMDCVDCHNRPAHDFHQPSEELDAALNDGRIDTSLPFVKREGLRLLQADYPSQAEARSAIQVGIARFYATQYPDVARSRASAVAEAGKVIGDVWSWNVFPQMKMTWDTYPVHLGHHQSPGCMRCHNEQHVAARTGEEIRADCNLCHNIVAQDDPAPAVLKELE